MTKSQSCQLDIMIRLNHTLLQLNQPDIHLHENQTEILNNLYRTYPSWWETANILGKRLLLRLLIQSKQMF